MTIHTLISATSQTNGVTVKIRVHADANTDHAVFTYQLWANSDLIGYVETTSLATVARWFSDVTEAVRLNVAVIVGSK